MLGHDTLTRTVLVDSATFCLPLAKRILYLLPRRLATDEGINYATDFSLSSTTAQVRISVRVCEDVANDLGLDGFFSPHTLFSSTSYKSRITLVWKKTDDKRNSKYLPCIYFPKRHQRPISKTLAETRFEPTCTYLY